MQAGLKFKTLDRVNEVTLHKCAYYLSPISSFPSHIAERCHILKLKHLFKLIKTAKVLILDELRKFKVYIAKILR